MQQTSDLSYALLAFGCMIIHIILQRRNYGYLPDWDSSSHLYCGFLLYKKVDIRHSYKVGIKWGLPRLYALIWPIIMKGFDHRIVNTLAGLSLIVFVAIHFAPDHGIAPLLCLYFITLFINSPYINSQTSCTEFLDTPLLLFLFSLDTGSNEGHIVLLQLLLICVISLLTKAINISYSLIPLLNFWENFSYEEAFLVFVLLTCTVGVLFLANRSSSSNYVKSRGILHAKGLKYIIANPVFFCLNCAASLHIATIEFGIGTQVILVAWGCLVIQRMPTFYFWYPITIFNAFFLVRNYDSVGDTIVYMFLWVLLVMSTFSIISLFFPPARFETMMRLIFGLERYNREFEYDTDMSNIKWLKCNIRTDEKVYLWGSKTVLLLKSDLLHVDTTYYSHNHLLYWSDINDNEGYAVDQIISKTPEYIIEAGTIEKWNFPIEKLAHLYKEEIKNRGMRVFCLRET